MTQITRIEATVARLHGLHPKLIDLTLGRLHALLTKLDHPERRLPPVLHVAGTNGKGSTCAFLRAITEAQGWRVHVYTSPHLVRFAERIVIAGREVDDATLEATLAEIETINAGAAITVFEVITAAALLLFARHPADVCILEVGLGGRYDATNVFGQPAAALTASISLDHQEFLGDTLTAIAGEKAGIIKPGAPALTGFQPPEVMRVLTNEARQVGAPLLRRGHEWGLTETGPTLRFEDASGSLILPRPGLPGAHQIDNAGLAVAALRASGLPIDAAAYAGIAHASWPARLQRLNGRLAARLPSGWELWLDGGHNEGAGVALAAQARAWADRPLHLIVGMKQSKNVAAFLRPLLSLATSIHAVAEPGQYAAFPPAAIVAASGGVARPAENIEAALAQIAARPAGRVLICGSLYLAGVVLTLDAPAASPTEPSG
jgi:dihydrofolate synthase/folylpolyglutamate synthase